MNPYFALSAIFALGLRGIEKKLELNVVPVTQMTLEDKKSGRVCSQYLADRSSGGASWR